MFESIKNPEVQQPAEKMGVTEQAAKKPGLENMENPSESIQKYAELLGSTRFSELKYSDGLSIEKISDFRKEMTEQGMSKEKVNNMCSELYEQNKKNIKDYRLDLKKNEVEYEAQKAKDLREEDRVRRMEAAAKAAERAANRMNK